MLHNFMEINEVSPKGWHGTIAAMLQKHPDKFSKEACKKKGKKKGGKICPYALAYSEKEKGDEPHYKDQPTSLKGKPKKKAKYKDEDKKKNEYSFASFLENRELCECVGNKMCAKCKAKQKKKY